MSPLDDDDEPVVVPVEEPVDELPVEPVDDPPVDDPPVDEPDVAVFDVAVLDVDEPLDVDMSSAAPPCDVVAPVSVTLWLPPVGPWLGAVATTWPPPCT